MVKKTRVMDEAGISRAMARIAHEIVERNRGASDLCVLGVQRKGVPLAEALCENICRIEGTTVPCGTLDVTPYRDDLALAHRKTLPNESSIPCDLQDKTVLIVDDVLYTGRTARAAIESVFALGRPKAVQLAALIDRGHRELPIRPDYVGKNLPTAKTEVVAVLGGEEPGVYICDL